VRAQNWKSLLLAKELVINSNKSFELAKTGSEIEEGTWRLSQQRVSFYLLNLSGSAVIAQGVDACTQTSEQSLPAPSM